MIQSRHQGLRLCVTISFILGVWGVAGCAHTSSSLPGAAEGKDRSQSEASSSPASGLEAAEDDTATPIGQERRGAPQKSILKDVVVSGVKIKESEFDLPIVLNSRVEYWVDYFTGRGRKHFVRYLQRSEYFIPYIEPLLEANGLPKDFVYLAMIESGFNNHARSRAKAVGPWQFIASTGKRYGLQVNWWVDERRDTHKSTLAALEYLKDLYSIYRSWELAAASYNAGEAKVARAVRRYGTRDFWELARHRFLRQETRDYVPKIIAAAIVSKNREAFGFTASELKQVAEDDPDQPTPKEIGENANQPGGAETQVEARELTIHEVIQKANGDLPAGTQAAASAEVMTQTQLASELGAKFDLASHASAVPQPHVNKGGEVRGEKVVEIEIPSPADLLMVSRAADIPYAHLKALNPELLRWVTPPHHRFFRIRLPASAKDRFVQAYQDPSFPKKADFLTYQVKPGQTLGTIARKFGIRVDPMIDLNGISPRMPLRSGVKVILPIPSDPTRSLASLEIRDPPERRRTRKRVKPSAPRGEFKVSAKARQAARYQRSVGRSPASSVRIRPGT